MVESDTVGTLQEKLCNAEHDPRRVDALACRNL